MVKTVTLASGVTVEWGIPTAHSQATNLGIVKSVGIDSVAKEKEYPGEDGECAAFIQYDPSDKLVLEIIAKTSATIPAVGAVLTHATVKYLVLSAKKNWSNEDCQSLSITARTFADITLT